MSRAANASSPYVATPGLYLLDTNVLLHYVRGGALKDRIEAQYSLMIADQVPLYSYVTEAEMWSLAEQRNWGKPKREQLRYLLGLFRRVPVEDREDLTLQAYVLIDGVSLGYGIDMGKNDLWIAATARVTTATLLTSDKDFDHLQGSFLSHEWIDPTL